MRRFNFTPILSYPIPIHAVSALVQSEKIGEDVRPVETRGSQKWHIFDFFSLVFGFLGFWFGLDGDVDVDRCMIRKRPYAGAVEFFCVFLSDMLSRQDKTRQDRTGQDICQPNPWLVEFITWSVS